MAEQGQLFSTVTLPERKGTSVSFTHDGEDYAISADQTYAWTVSKKRGSGFKPIVSFGFHDGQYIEYDDLAGPQAPVDDWRQIVRHYI